MARRALIACVHAVLVISAYVLAFLLRFDFALPRSQVRVLAFTLPIIVIIRLLVFWRMNLFQGLWRYVGTQDLRQIILAVALSSGLFGIVALAIHMLGIGAGFPRSVIVLDALLAVGLVVGVRLASRELRELNQSQSTVSTTRKVVIVGAGDAGDHLLRAIQGRYLSGYLVVGLIDDDPRKQNARMHGVPVIGRPENLPEVCEKHKVEEILLAMPGVSDERRRQVIEPCLKARVPIRTVPSLPELESGAADISRLRTISPEDLLGRQAVEVDIERLLHEISGKRVMVTGAGGSIGSELCRQLASLDPELIIMYERAESPLYFTDAELRERFKNLRTVPVVGDILDEPKLREIVNSYKPDVIYHAAAYKHVPLMEAQPLEAIQNNVFGTEMVAHVALDAGVKKFVMISTDKAVRPVGIMGMTKKVAEDVCSSLNSERTAFVSVRFGNVLGSAGSVLPLFEAQIARGVPVTLTDPDATRYFMVIAEAAQLVLQAGAMGKGGEVFFLDMGQPVKIGELAENVIRLSGKEPGRDVQVQTIGMRPGERLTEQLVRDQEELTVSEHEKVFLAQGSGRIRDDFAADFEELRALLIERDHSSAVQLLSEMAGRD